MCQAPYADDKYLKELLIGIDTGVNTGVGIIAKYNENLKNKSVIVFCGSMMIHRAWQIVMGYYAQVGDRLKVYVEDARLRKWYGRDSNSKMQGAGSVKRDAKIWEDFLTDLGCDFKLCHPVKGGTKLNAERFEKVTKWKKRTNEHGRDAIMLIWGR